MDRYVLKLPIASLIKTELAVIMESKAVEFQNFKVVWGKHVSVYSTLLKKLALIEEGFVSYIVIG